MRKRKHNKLRFKPSVVADIEKILSGVKSKKIKQLVNVGGSLEEDISLVSEIANWNAESEKQDIDASYEALRSALIPKSISKILAAAMKRKYSQQDKEEAKKIIENINSVIKENSKNKPGSGKSSASGGSGESEGSGNEAVNDPTVIKKSGRSSITGSARSITSIRKNVISLVKNIKTLTDDSKKNHKELIESVQKNSESLTTIKQKIEASVKPKLSTSSKDVTPDLVTPEEFAMYPGAPKEPGGRFRDPKKGTFAKTPTPKQIKEYAKRSTVDPFGDKINLILGDIESMLEQDSAIRKSELEDLKEELKKVTSKDNKDNKDSIFNLESDEQKQILEKALTEALENIIRKHPDMFQGGGEGSGGLTDWIAGLATFLPEIAEGATALATAASTIGAAGIAAGTAVTGAGLLAMEAGLNATKKETVKNWSKLENQGITKLWNNKGGDAGFMYEGKSYKMQTDLPKKAQDIINTNMPDPVGYRKGTAGYNEATLRLKENNYDAKDIGRPIKEESTTAPPKTNSSTSSSKKKQEVDLYAGQKPTAVAPVADETEEQTVEIKSPVKDQTPKPSDVDYDLEEVVITGSSKRHMGKATPDSVLLGGNKQTVLRPPQEKKTPFNWLNDDKELEIDPSQLRSDHGQELLDKVTEMHQQQQELMDQQQLAPTVNNIITNPPPPPAPKDDGKIQAYNNDSTFNRLLMQDFEHPSTQNALMMG